MVKMLEALESGTSSESESDSPDESYSKDSSNTSKKKSSTTEVSKSDSDVPFTKDKVASTEDSDSEEEKLENSKTNGVSKKQCTELQDIDENSNSSDIPLIKLIPKKEKVSGEVYKTEDNIFNKKREVKPLIDSDTKEEKLGNPKTNGVSKKQCTELIAIDENSNSSDIPLIKLIPTKEKVKLSDQTSKHKNLTSNSETEGKQKNAYCDPSMNTLSVLPLEIDSGVQVSVSKSITKKSQLTKKETEELDTKQNIKKKKGGKPDNTWSQTKSSKIKKKLEISSDENDSDGNVSVDENNSSKNEDECKISDSASKSFSSEDDPKVVRQSPAANQNRPGPASSKKKSAKKIQSINAQTEEFKISSNVKRRKCDESDSSQLQLSKTKRKLEISSDDNDSDGNVSIDERDSTKNQEECKISDSASKNLLSDNNTKAGKRSPVSNQNRPGPASSKKKSAMKIHSNNKQPEELEKKNLKRKRSGESDSSQLQLSKPKRKLEISSDDNDSDGNVSMDEKNSTENKDECKINDSASKNLLPDNNTKAGKRSPVSNQNRPGPASSKKKSVIKIQSNNNQPEELEKKNFKRKRSGESDSSQSQLSKTKRKLEISSDDNDSDGNVSMDEKNSIKNEEECKIGNAASKGFSSDNGDKIETKMSVSKKNKPGSTKKDPTTDGNSSKPSDTANKKLDDSDILERLEDVSDGSDDSSEESEADEKFQEKSSKELTSSDSMKTQEKPKMSQKNGRKIAAKKKPAAKNAVSESDDDDCSDEAKPMKNSKSSGGKSKSEGIESSSSNSSCSDDSNSNSPSEKKKEVAKKPEKPPKSDSKKEVGKKIGDNPRITRLQRYLKEAGIRVQNYKTLWHGCKSEKARAEKLLELLRERGLKGKPSVSECRKLKRRNEKEKEISELNTSNIISTNGRSRRGTASLFASRCAPSLDKSTNEEPSRQKSPEFKKVFGRLKAIVDSEDSD